MKIAFYTTYLGRGGAERVMLALAEYLKRRHEVVIITDVQGEDEYTVPENVKRLNIGEAEKSLYNTGRIKTAWRLVRLRKFLKQEAPDVVVGFMESCSIRMVFCGWGLKTRKVATIRMNPYVRYQNRWKKYIICKWFEMTDYVIFQTEEQRDFFSDKVRKKSRIIFNPVSGKLLKEPIVRQKVKKIVTVGRIDANKNHELLIQAFCEIAEEFPEYILEIYGDGVLTEQLGKLIEQLGMQKRIFLKGSTDNVLSVIRDASVFAFTSRSEGMPNAVMEAMALGVPVVSTKFRGGAAQMLIESGKNGILVEDADKKHFAESLKYMLTHPEEAERMAENAKRDMSRLDSNTICGEWENIILKL